MHNIVFVAVDAGMALCVCVWIFVSLMKCVCLDVCVFVRWVHVRKLYACMHAQVLELPTDVGVKRVKCGPARVGREGGKGE